MAVRLNPKTEARLQELAAASGRSPDDLVQDAMAGYLDGVAETRHMLDSRYDDVIGGRVKAVDGDQTFARIRSKSQGPRSTLKQRT